MSGRMTLTQWGAFRVDSENGLVTGTTPLPHDPDPSPIGRSLGAVTSSVHGNPNVLTTDAGSSGLAQGSTAHTCLVEVELYLGVVPDIDPHAPPELLGS